MQFRDWKSRVFILFDRENNFHQYDSITHLNFGSVVQVLTNSAVLGLLSLSGLFVFPAVSGLNS